MNREKDGGTVSYLEPYIREKESEEVDTEFQKIEDLVRNIRAKVLAIEKAKKEREVANGTQNIEATVLRIDQPRAHRKVIEARKIHADQTIEKNSEEFQRFLQEVQRHMIAYLTAHSMERGKLLEDRLNKIVPKIKTVLKCIEDEYIALNFLLDVLKPVDVVVDKLAKHGRFDRMMDTVKEKKTFYRLPQFSLLLNVIEMVYIFLLTKHQRCAK